MTNNALTVVAAVDKSALSMLALDEAISRVAQHPDSELHVIQVFSEEPYSPALDRAAEALRKYVAERIAVAQQEKLPFTSQRAVVHITSGGIANEIVQLATDLHADYIMLGTHGRTGVERLILGSVAEHVVRIAPCPVIVLRNKDFSAGVPEIEPPCPRCMQARRQSGGRELWCATHSEHRARRHTYHSVRPDGARHSPYSGGIA